MTDLHPVRMMIHVLSASEADFDCWKALDRLRGWRVLGNSVRSCALPFAVLGNGMMKSGTEIMQVQHKHETVFGGAVGRVWSSQGRDSP